MATYKQLQDQIARLQREADATRQSETTTVVNKLKKQIALYGLTAADLGFGKATSATGRRQPAGKKAASESRPRRLPADQGGRSGAGVAKYRHPNTGATWSGYGRIPAWLASVKDRSRFLIDAAEAGASATPVTGTEEPAPKPAARATRKGKAQATPAKTAASKRAVCAALTRR